MTKKAKLLESARRHVALCQSCVCGNQREHVADALQDIAAWQGRYVALTGMWPQVEFGGVDSDPRYHLVQTSQSIGLAMQAADLLHMSRPHLLKFMDCGALAFHRVGAHRRIKMADLLDFVDRREQAKADVAHTLGNPKALDDQARSAAAELSESDLREFDSI